MQFETGFDFERAVFGLCSSGDRLLGKFKGGRADFSEAVKAFIARSRIIHPSTKIGEALYLQMVREFDRLGVGHEELVFLPSVDTEIDLFHGADGVVFHPLFFPRLVLVDAFNIRPTVLLRLRETWIDSFNGKIYSWKHFLSDLFLFKKGKSKWRRDNKEALEQEALGKGFVIRPKDFRQLAEYGRRKNEFILTPIDACTYEGRRLFAKLVVGYLCEIANEPDHENTALLSH